MSDNYSLVVENAREEVLSSDLVRMETLGQTQMLDQFSDEARSDDAPTYDADFGATKGDRNNSTGATRLPTLIADVGFQMTLGQFQILVNDGASGSDLNNEASSLKVFRGAGGTLTFAVPDATNPRIDLVVMTAGTINTDLQSRNILLDPVARTVASQIVPKRQNPQVTVSVLTGTPDGTSIPGPVPAVPGVGQVAIFEVLIPAAALDSTEFSTVRRIFRRVEFPGAAAHGILQGCQLSTSSVADTISAIAQIRSGTAIGSQVNKVVIDGEVIPFHAGVSGTLQFQMFTQDAGAANPFAVAAPANNDLPYYIYACGGRHLSQGRLGIPWGGNPTLEPICLVESLTQPDANGRPSGLITTPRGTTIAGALYVGVGWVVEGSTRRKCVRYSGDWAFANVGIFNDAPTIGIPIVNTDITFLSAPVTSDQAEARLLVTTAATPVSVTVATKDSTLNALAATRFLAIINAPILGDSYMVQNRVFFRSGVTPHLTVKAFGAATADGYWNAYGYNMNVRRYGSY